MEHLQGQLQKLKIFITNFYVNIDITKILDYNYMSINPSIIQLHLVLLESCIKIFLLRKLNIQIVQILFYLFIFFTFDFNGSKSYIVEKFSCFFYSLVQDYNHSITPDFADMPWI